MNGQCECDQICCTWCAVHGDTGVDIDAIARDHDQSRGCGVAIEVVHTHVERPGSGVQNGG